MADTFTFDLVSPERVLTSVAATAVQIPAMDGDMTAMPNHAPFLTTLRPGVVKVTSVEGVAEFVVTGGFAEVSPTSVSILAEEAVPRVEAGPGLTHALSTAAEAALKEAPEDLRMAAGQRVRDVLALKSQLGH